MKISLKDNCLDILFNDSATNNAFNLEKALQLKKHLGDKNIALIFLCNEGRYFCSGGNLRDYAKAKTKQQGLAVNKKIRDVLEMLASHPAVKIAYLSGDCIGGGVELASCCDQIITSPDVFMALWQGKMALSFGWGGYERLQARMKSHVIQQWLLEENLKSAYWCRRQGLVDDICSAVEMEKRLARIRKALKNRTTQNLRELRSGLERDEVKLFEKLWWSPEHRARLEKFGSRS